MAHDEGLTEGEHIVLRLHPHWKTVLRPILLLAVIVAAVIVALVYLPASADKAPVRLGIGVVAVLLALVFTLVPFLRWRTTTYELTNRRLRLRSGILTRRGRDFPLARISDVSFSHGVLDRILGCGRLVVESAGEHGQLVLTEIPRVVDVQARLFQLVEDEQAGPAAS
ncbi:MAG TPA: PH domain-containing protein [Streptosporangiaceae bacterium]|nr:PH domain-containing protein [Streptosporangiaceae bacterium]